MNVELYNELHSISREIIEEQILESPLPIVMLTHHMPSYDLIDEKYKTPSMSKYNQCFASNCSKYFVHPIKCWLYGHTHKPKVAIINGIKFGCNPKGYNISHENHDINIINLIEV